MTLLTLTEATEQNETSSLFQYFFLFKSKLFYDCFDLFYQSIYTIIILLISFILLRTQLKSVILWKKLLHILRVAAKTIVGGIIVLLVLPPIFPIIIAAFIASRTIKKLLLRNPSYCEAVGIDVIWGSDDVTSRPFITVLSRCRGKPNVDKVKKMLTDKILTEKTSDGEYRFRKFRQNLVKRFNFWLWKDVDDFSVENHVSYVDLEKILPRENEEVDEDEYVSQYLSDSTQPMLSLEHPQWQLLVIDTGNENTYSMVFRFHHGIADGISLVRLMIEKMIDNPYNFGEYRKSQTFLQKLVTQLWAIPLFPYSLKLLIFRAGNNPLHGPKLSGNKIFLTSKPIPMADLRQIKDASKTGITDILFSCLSAAVAKYFHKRGFNQSDIVIAFPVGYQDPCAPLVLTNVFGMALTTFTTVNSYVSDSRESDSVIRLKEIKASFDEIRSDPSVLALFNASRVISYIAPDFFIKSLFATNGLTMGVSNMPGPKNALILVGDEVESFRFWVPDRAPTGVGFTMLSYMDNVRVSFNVDTAIIDDRKVAQSIMENFMDEIENLKREFNIE